MGSRQRYGRGGSTDFPVEAQQFAFSSMRYAESVPNKEVSCMSPVPLKRRNFCGTEERQRWG